MSPPKRRLAVYGLSARDSRDSFPSGHSGTYKVFRVWSLLHHPPSATAGIFLFHPPRNWLNFYSPLQAFVLCCDRATSTHPLVFRRLGAVCLTRTVSLHRNTIGYYSAGLPMILDYITSLSPPHLVAVSLLPLLPTPSGPFFILRQSIEFWASALRHHCLNCYSAVPLG